MRARNEEADARVRERVQKAKVELEQRLRAQIEQEWKDEMEAARRREVSIYFNYCFFKLATLVTY